MQRATLPLAGRLGFPAFHTGILQDYMKGHVLCIAAYIADVFFMYGLSRLVDAKGRDLRLVEEHFERVGSSDDDEGVDADGAGPSTSDSDHGLEAGAADSDGLIGEDSDEDYQRRRARKQAIQVWPCGNGTGCFLVCNQLCAVLPD